MNPATIIQLLMAVLGSQTGRNILRRGMTGESFAKVFGAMRGAGTGVGNVAKVIKPDAVKAFVQGLAANPIGQAASEGGMGVIAKVLGMVKAHPIITAATALPIAGMMIGRGEDDRRAEAQGMMMQQGGGEGGAGGGMQKDLRNAMMLMQLSKLMQRAQDNSQEMTLPAGMRTPDDAMMLM